MGIFQGEFVVSTEVEGLGMGSGRGEGVVAQGEEVVEGGWLKTEGAVGSCAG